MIKAKKELIDRPQKIRRFLKLFPGTFFISQDGVEANQIGLKLQKSQGWRPHHCQRSRKDKHRMSQGKQLQERTSGAKHIRPQIQATPLRQTLPLRQTTNEREPSSSPSSQSSPHCSVDTTVNPQKHLDQFQWIQTSFFSHSDGCFCSIPYGQTNKHNVVSIVLFCIYIP